MNSQVKIKAEQIARMIVAGKKATQIALEMNMSYGGLQRILACPEYKAIENDVRATNLGNMDASLAKRAQLVKDLDDAVPDAMQCLIDAVKQKRDLRMALQAATQVLDRDPRKQFTKQTQAEAARNPASQTPSLPQSMLDSIMTDADATRDILLRVPLAQQKPAEA